jgi:hypothetical protein
VEVEVVVTRISLASFSAGVFPARDEPGPFLSQIRSTSDERR